jgi:hypothetical protein
MIDEAEYAIPLGRLGGMFQPLVERDIRRIFDYRNRTIQAALTGP